MAEVKWIKITTNMFDDEKIRIIESMPEADAILVMWIKLITLAGKCNGEGCIYLSETIPYTDEMLATIFNRPLNTVRLALHTFKQFGMVEYKDNGFLKLVNWDKHQNIEGLDKIREQTRKRVAKHRENQKVLPVSVALPVTQSNAIELDKKKKENKDTIPKELFGEFVMLSKEQFQTLLEKYKDDLPKMIEILDNYLGQNEKNLKRYTSHYHALKGWVKDRVLEEKAKNTNHFDTRTTAQKALDKMM